MKRLCTSLKALAGMMLLLVSSACSSTEQPPVTESKPTAENKQTTTEPQQTNNANTPTGQETKPEQKEEKKDSATKETSSDKKDSTSPRTENKAKSLPTHKNVTVVLEGMKETKQGTLFKSPQGYYLYTLPKFTASAEEPGKDIILTSYDERHTMRIELLPKDASVSKLIENAKEDLATLGEVNEQKDVADPFFNQAKAYLFASDTKTTRVIIIQEVAGTLFRFTFTVANAESAEGIIPSYWAMIKTIGILK